MMPIQKIIGVMSWGFLLCLGLSGCAASAPDEMKADQSAERIGGQAGLKADEEKLKGIVGQSAERIGGQAGLKADEDKLEGVAN
jgi:starvation-inducible outer membrane lipoprotein